MRSYTTVREILRRVSRWHQELLENCDGDCVPPQDPLHMLVEYLCVHERTVKQMLDGDDGNEKEAVLNTWLQYVPAEGVEDVIRRWQAAESPSAEDVMAFVVEFDEALVEFFQSLAGQSQAPPRVNAVFQNLLEAQEWQRLRNAWSIRDSDSFYTGRG